MQKTFKLLAMVILLACLFSSQATAAPVVTITLVNPPPDGLLVLDVGESYTFEVLVESDELFIQAAAMPDQFYPGRGIFYHGGDRVTRDTSAELHLTVTGKNSTADLQAVCDWPEPGVCWPEGVAPAAVVAGARYKGGQVVAEVFSFAVRVP